MAGGLLKISDMVEMVAISDMMGSVRRAEVEDDGCAR